MSNFSILSFAGDKSAQRAGVQHEVSELCKASVLYGNRRILVDTMKTLDTLKGSAARKVVMIEALSSVGAALEALHKGEVIAVESRTLDDVTPKGTDTDAKARRARILGAVRPLIIETVFGAAEMLGAVRKGKHAENVPAFAALVAEKFTAVVFSAAESIGKKIESGTTEKKADVIESLREAVGVLDAQNESLRTRYTNVAEKADSFDEMSRKRSRSTLRAMKLRADNRALQAQVMALQAQILALQSVATTPATKTKRTPKAKTQGELIAA